jgi:hypothetical protein
VPDSQRRSAVARGLCAALERMNFVLDIGADHVAGALSGDVQSLRRLYDARLAGWGKPFFSGECFTIGTFSDLEEEIESDVAFRLVGAAVDIVLEQSRADEMVFALSLLRTLAEATNTTEVPAPLRAASQTLSVKARALSSDAERQFVELVRYYRNAL